METQERPLTTLEAAEFLNVPRHTLIRAVREGKLPARKMGKFYYFKPSDLMAFFESLPTVGSRLTSARVR